MDSEHLTSPGSRWAQSPTCLPSRRRRAIWTPAPIFFPLALVLYEMATGTFPSAERVRAVIFEAILGRAPVPAVRLNPDVPAKLEEIIDKALEKDPRLRYQHATDLRTDLQRVKRDMHSGVLGSSHRCRWLLLRAAGNRRSRPTFIGRSSGTAASAQAVAPAQPVHSSGSSVVAAAKRHKLGLTAGIVVALMVLAAAGYGVYSLICRKAEIPFQNFTISQITDTGKSGGAAISPDGKYILNVQDQAGKASLWLRHVPTNSDTQIIAPTEAQYRELGFSPDGNYFVFRKARSKLEDSLDLYAPRFSAATRRLSLAMSIRAPHFPRTASASSITASTIRKSANSNCSWPIPMVPKKK